MQYQEVTIAFHSAEDDARMLTQTFQAASTEAAVCKSWLEDLQQHNTSSSLVEFFRDKVKSTEISLSDITSELAVTEIKLQGLQERTAVEGDDTEDEISESALQEEKGRLQEELKSVDKEIAKLQSEANESVKVVKEAEDKLEELRASAEEAANRVKAVEGNICRLAAQEKQLQKELHGLVSPCHLLCIVVTCLCNRVSFVHCRTSQRISVQGSNAMTLCRLMRPRPSTTIYN